MANEPAPEVPCTTTTAGIPVTVPAMPVAALFRAAFPIETESFALVLVDSTTDSRTGATVPGVRADADGNTWATLQLIVRDQVDGELAIRDIKEQDVVVLGAAQRDDPRIEAYVAGWRAAVLEVFTRQEALWKSDRDAFGRFKHNIDTLMPHDLCAGGILLLKRPRDEAGFRDALLSSKKRLGRLLP